MATQVRGTDAMTFSSYLEQIKRTPLLSAEHERELFAAYRAGDIRAREKLVASHLKLVVSAATRYAGLHELEDLVSVGCAGLLIAVERFEPDNPNNARLNTYARWWIDAELNKFVMDNHSSVKIGTTKNQKVIFFSAGRVARSLGIADTSNMTPEQTQQLADALQVDPCTLVETLQRMRASPSLNTPVSDEFDAGDWIEFIPDESLVPVDEALGEAQEHEQAMVAINERIAELTDREKDILVRRIMADEPVPLDVLATTHNRSRERCRQLQETILWKLRGRNGASPSSKNHKSTRVKRASINKGVN